MVRKVAGRSPRAVGAGCVHPRPAERVAFEVGARRSGHPSRSPSAYAGRRARRRLARVAARHGRDGRVRRHSLLTDRWIGSDTTVTVQTPTELALKRGERILVSSIRPACSSFQAAREMSGASDTDDFSTVGQLRRATSFWLLLPLLLLLAVAFAAPIGRLLWGSVFSPDATWAHYLRVFDEPIYLRIFSEP